MKRRTRRDTETFSMSFLDCICCGFGAIILLLVLNEFGEPIQLEQSKVDLDQQIEKMEKDASAPHAFSYRASAAAIFIGCVCTMTSPSWSPLMAVPAKEMIMNHMP